MDRRYQLTGHAIDPLWGVRRLMAVMYETSQLDVLRERERQFMHSRRPFT